MDKTSLYQEGRTFLHGRTALALLIFPLLGGFFLAVGSIGAFSGELPLILVAGCFWVVAAAFFLWMPVQMWRIYHSPVLLLTAEIRHKRTISNVRWFGAHTYRITVRPVAAVRLEADGNESPFPTTNLPTNLKLNLEQFNQMQEGDRVQLLCSPLLHTVLRVVRRLAKAAEPEEAAAPGVEKPATPPKNTAELYQEYRSYLQGRAALVLLIGLPTSGLFCGVAPFGLLLGDVEGIGGFFCSAAIGVAALAIMGGYLLHLWQARPARLTAIVAARREAHYRSQHSVLLRRTYHLRLRPISAAHFNLTANGESAPAERIPLSIPGKEVEYSVPRDLFEQAIAGERLDLLVVPSLKRVIARIDA
jgi:hypothetical protein